MFSNGLTQLTKSLMCAAIAIGSSLVITGNAMADGTFFGESATGKWIIGGKISNIDPNSSEVNDAPANGVLLGYEFDKEIAGGTAAFELEYIQGDEERINVNFNGTYEASVLNAFFSYRSAGNLYYKFKGGLSYVDVDIRDSQVVNLNFIIPSDVRDRSVTNLGFEDTSVAFGIGLGYRFFDDHAKVELEYTQDIGDSDLGIVSLNGLYSF